MSWVLVAAVLAIALRFLQLRLKKPVPSVRVFRTERGFERLPASISIQTGETSTVILTRGGWLPLERREQFSTSSEGQAAIEVQLLVGDRPLAADNVRLARLHLVGIAPQPAGAPLFEVRFRVDERGTLSFVAVDRRSGEPQPLELSHVMDAALDAKALDALLPTGRDP